ncbi:MAG: chemotaxis protein CheW [bacterium]
MGKENKRKAEEKDAVYEKEESSPLPSCGLAEDILGTRSSDENFSSENMGRRAESVNRASRDEGLMKFVTFFLESEEYALPISQVQEINRIGEITRVPNSPEHVRGVINLRGKIVPVIELKKRLQLGETSIDKDSRIVVVEHGPKVLGLMVDRVAQVLNISAEQIDEVPEEVVQIDENYIKGIGKINGRMIIILELGKVIAQ